MRFDDVSIFARRDLAFTVMQKISRRMALGKHSNRYSGTKTE